METLHSESVVGDSEVGDNNIDDDIPDWKKRKNLGKIWERTGRWDNSLSESIF